MTYRKRILCLTFIESFSTVLLERAVYFFTRDQLGFSETNNLWLALVFGLLYVPGALSSHAAAVRWSERRVLTGTLLGLLGLHVILAVQPTSAVIVVCFGLIGLLHGMKWPIVESYASAGQSPRQTLRTLGWYNAAWSLAVPLALAASGPVIASASPAVMFLIAGAINVVSLALMRPLRRRPTHLAEDHPERLPPEQRARYEALMRSGRWAMLGSYAMLFLIAPLMPAIFADLGLAVAQATWAASLMDVAKFATFAAMGALLGWHGRIRPMAATLIVLPASFLLMLFGPNLGTVLVGEVLFGVASGVTYYVALYHAMVVKNASVDAGGAHESLIGLGFVVGPMAGLVGHALSAPLGGYVWGMLAAVAPMLILCTVCAAWPLKRRSR